MYLQSDAEMKRLKKYHTQQYVNGTKCDISGKHRNTEVRVSYKKKKKIFLKPIDFCLQVI